MITDSVLKLAKIYGIDTSKDEDLKSLLNDVRILLELNIKLRFCGTKKMQCDCEKSRNTEDKINSKDFTLEEYFDFLYNQGDPEKVLAVKEYFTKVGETVKTSLETDCAAVKGTLEDGVNEIITDAEKAIVEEVTKVSEDVSEKFADKFADELGDVTDEVV